MQISSHTNRHRVKAWGLFEGGDGTNTIIAFRRKGETEWVRAREAFGCASYGKFSNIVVNEGDEMLFVTPSGGGYGDALERDPELVLARLADELLPADDARRRLRRGHRRGAGSGRRRGDASVARAAPGRGEREVTVYREVNELPRCGSCGKLLTVGGIEAERLGHPLVFCSRAVHPRLRHLQGAEVRRMPRSGPSPSCS